MFLAFALGCGLVAFAPADQRVPSSTPPSSMLADTVDPVAILLDRLNAGEVELAYDTLWGYLPSVLEELDIPVSSQSLVFSKTSLQTQEIEPHRPRAIYFNDDVYVGFVLDGIALEIASIDPDDGVVFYTIDQSVQDRVALARDELACFTCHTQQGVLGVHMTSVVPDRRGDVISTISWDMPTQDRTPMSERFGGWYVTGRHSLPHAGNVMADVAVTTIADEKEFARDFDTSVGANVTSLEDRFYEPFYMTQGSDIVALLILAHQTHLHNRITLAADLTNEALQELEYARLVRGADDAQGLSVSSDEKVTSAARTLARALLFHRAAPIGQVESGGTFREDFESLGPFDSKGRSLRDLSLDGQLFEYPLSFLIYTDAFDALPEITLGRTYAAIHELLSTDVDNPDFPLLNTESRTAIHEILLETKPSYADFVASLGSAGDPG